MTRSPDDPIFSVFIRGEILLSDQCHQRSSAVRFSDDPMALSPDDPIFSVFIRGEILLSDQCHQRSSAVRFSDDPMARSYCSLTDVLAYIYDSLTFSSI